MQTHNLDLVQGPDHNKTSLHHNDATHARHEHENSTDRDHLDGARAPDHRPVEPLRYAQDVLMLFPCRSMLQPIEGHWLVLQHTQQALLHNEHFDKPGHLLLATL